MRALLEAAGAVLSPALGACPNWNTTFFFEAAKLSDVTRCLQTGVDLEARDRGGATPLYKAVINGTAEVVRALLGAGANPNARGFNLYDPATFGGGSVAFRGRDGVTGSGRGPCGAERRR